VRLPGRATQLGATLKASYALSVAPARLPLKAMLRDIQEGQLNG